MGYGLCGLFAPGNKYAVVGTKEGTFEIIDVRSGACVQVVKAHGDAVRSFSSLPDGSGFVSSSSDQEIKFWEYQSVRDSGQNSEYLTVSHTWSRKMDVDAVVVAVSPDERSLLLRC